MRIEIEIPKEFEKDFKQDKFEDCLKRLNADAHAVAGNYEQETALMLINAFKNSKPAYDLENVVKKLKRRYGIVNSCSLDYAEGLTDAYERAIGIVRGGGYN